MCAHQPCAYINKNTSLYKCVGLVGTQIVCLCSGKTFLLTKTYHYLVAFKNHRKSHFQFLVSDVRNSSLREGTSVARIDFFFSSRIPICLTLEQKPWFDFVCPQRLPVYKEDSIPVFSWVCFGCSSCFPFF